MNIIDKAVAHYSKGVNREIHVEEWEETLYAKNLSLEDRSKLISRAGDDSMLYLVYACIYGLVNKDGDQVFDLGDKPKLLKHVDPDIIVKLANFVLKVDSDPKN
jgi:hypothetical protein